MSERFERHRQPWRQDEIQKLHVLAGKGMSLKAIAKALTRSEESVKDRAKLDRSGSRNCASSQALVGGHFTAAAYALSERLTAVASRVGAGARKLHVST